MGMYKPSVEFADKSNRAKQSILNYEEKKKRFCMKHPTAYWGNDQYGNPYTRCAYGHKLNEDCQEVTE